MPKALITGAGGFVGKFLSNHLTSLGYEAIGTSLHGESRNGGKTVALDIRDAEAVQAVVTKSNFDEIYHLASITRPYLESVNEFYDVNLYGTLNLLEAASKTRAKVLVVSSAYVYGRQNGLIDEHVQLQPVNHYGASKAAADLASIGYSFGSEHIVRVRPFNHSGPGQPPDFLLPTLVRQVVRMEAGLESPVIKLGNMESVRDFSDVRDVVMSYPRLLQRGENGAAYNLASENGVSVKELVEKIRHLARIPFCVESEATRRRSRDIPRLVGDASAATRINAWEQSYSLMETISDMLEFEREKYKLQ